MTLVVCVLAALAMTTYLSGVDLDGPANMGFVFLLIASATGASLLSWFVWILLGRAIFGGGQFYKMIEATATPVFIKGSRAAKSAAPFAIAYDRVLRRLLGI